MGFVFLSIILVLPLSYGLASWIVSTTLTKTNIVGGDLSNADRISTPISFRERQDNMPHMRTNDMYEPFCLKALKVLQNSPEFLESKENALEKSDAPIIAITEPEHKPEKTPTDAKALSKAASPRSWKDAITEKTPEDSASPRSWKDAIVEEDEDLTPYE